MLFPKAGIPGRVNLITSRQNKDMSRVMMVGKRCW